MYASLARDYPPAIVDKVRDKRARRETSGWRTIYIDPHEQTPDDIFAQLALILLQEGVVSKADDEVLHEILRYLKMNFSDCRDRDFAVAGRMLHTAGRTLNSALRNYVEPIEWRGWWDYLKKTAAGHAKNKWREEVASEQQERFVDADSEIYNPRWVAQQFDVDMATLYRWRQKHGYIDGNGSWGFSKEKFEDLKWEFQEREELIDHYATARGIEKKSAQRWIKRQEAKELSREEIQQKVRQASLEKLVIKKWGTTKKDAKHYIACRLRQGDSLAEIAKDLMSDA